MTNFLNRIYASNWWTSILAGVLLGVSFSPFNIALLTIPGFMLLFRIADRCLSMREVMYFTFPGFLVWNIIGTYWLTWATPAGGVAAIVANAILMTIPFGIIHLIRRAGLRLISAAFLSAMTWVAYEYLHLHWDLAWPWLMVANAFANFPILVQYITFTGPLGISFWVIFSAALLQLPRYLTDEPTAEQALAEAEKAESDSSDSTTEAPVNVSLKGSYTIFQRFNPIYLALIFAFPLFSTAQFFLYNEKPVDVIEVVVAQPNYDSYLPDAGYDDTSVALNELVALTASVVSDSTRAIFWPENAIMIPIFGTGTRYPVGQLLNYASNWSAPIISGATWYRYYEEDEIPVVHRVNAAGNPFNVYNAAIGFMPDGELKFYEKAKLVPIVERFPFIDLLGHWENRWFDWGSLSGYGRGTEMVNFPVAGTSSPALVCYDSVFPGWVRESVFQGAGFITVVTNDGWWGDTSGHIQHFDFARLRAIENRRAVVRSANNGISGLIDSRGTVLARTDYWVQTALALQVPVHEELTFYTRYGDWLGVLSIIFTVIAILWSPIRWKSSNIMLD